MISSRLFLFSIILIAVTSCSHTKPSKTRNLKNISTSMKKVKATFEFYSIKKNDQIPNGSFNMIGDLNKESQRLNLKGESWIRMANNYDLVDLIGIFDEGFETFGGAIKGNQCQEFSLKKIKKSPGDLINGMWKGVYSCSQGITGLKLTIKSQI